MRVENPFFHRGAIRRAEEFHGREAEIRQILELCGNGQSISIIGPRRIGKSSLLLHLCRPTTRSRFSPATNNTIFALVDCQELGGSPPEEVYEALMSIILDAARLAGLDLQPVQRSGTYRSLDRVLTAIYDSGFTVVVLLDEFELLAANERLTPYFFARLRGLTTKYGLAYLTASQRPLFAIAADEQILSSPFFNIFVTLSLSLYTEEEARDLLQRRLEGTGVSFSEDLCDEILELVGPHPFFLHIAGYHAFRALTQSQIPLDHTNRMLWLDAPLEIESESHLGYLWLNLTEEEQYCLATAEGPIDTIRQLEQLCLLQRSEAGYVYTGQILQRFVRRQQVKGLIQVGPFVIDKQRHQVHAGGREINLTTSQFNLLVRLCIQPGQVINGENLESAVWGDALVDDPDRLKTLIKRLRRAIGPYSGWVVSERGVGYALREPGS
jgi:hypothetical protein